MIFFSPFKTTFTMNFKPAVSCGIQHVLVNGIFRQDAGAGLGGSDKLAAMVRHDGFIGGNAGQHGFPAAGKTGKEMGFNKPWESSRSASRRPG